jgi:hypothetical protein
VGNRLHNLLRLDGSPRWVRLLALAVGVGLVALAFYVAIRLSLDVGAENWDE